MSAPQFTPGPWLIHATHRWVVPAEDARKEPAESLPICQLRDPDERLTEDETLANGFLLAAAPDLYGQVETAAIIFEEYAQLHLAKCTLEANAKAKRNMEFALTMRAALAKARGET